MKIMSCFSGDYADPKDVATIPPKLPERPKSGLSTKSVAMSSRNMKIQPKKGKLVQPSSKTIKNSAKFKKPSSKMSSKFSPMFQPCVNVNQRRVVKYNFLLSIAINVLILALGGTGFISVLSTDFENESSYQYGKGIEDFQLAIKRSFVFYQNNF